MKEGVLPTREQLMVCSETRLKRFFGRDIVIPIPPEELFLDLEKVIKFGVKKAKVYYQPGYTFTEKTQLDGWKVRPWSWFWRQIKEGNIPPETATLEEGWYIDLDPEGMPPDKDDYLAPIMKKLRETGHVQRMQELERTIRFQLMKQLGAEGKIYQFPGDAVVPEDSRFGSSPEEIREVILPYFAQILQVAGRVRNKRFMEFNVWGNMANLKRGDGCSEYFEDKFSVRNKSGNVIGCLNLLGGNSYNGGLAFVYRPWAERSVRVGFSLVIAHRF